MAVGVAEAQATVTSKFKLGNTKYGYVGTFALGTEYATGGNTIGTEAESRFKLPEKVDFAFVQGGGYGYELASGKLLIRAAGKEKEAGAQAAAKTDVSAAKPAFYIIGS